MDDQTLPANNGPLSTIASQLLPSHLADLRRSGLSDSMIEVCQFASVADPQTISRYLNWNRPATGIGACLLIPFRDLNGHCDGYVRMKPDHPRTNKGDGKLVKYESPRGKPNRAYFPMPALAAIRTPAAPLLVTEGEKKASAATQAGFPCIGLTGVWSWQKKRKNKKSPRKLIEDLAAIDWNGRPVVICFDSDINEKPEIEWAEFYFAAALAAARASVTAIRLPGGTNGEKVGLDDFLVAHGDLGPNLLRDLLAAAKAVTRPEDPRPEVLLTTLEHVAIGQAIGALARCDPDIYQRGNVLVRLTVPKRAPARSRITLSGTPTAEPIPTANLRARITQYANVVNLVTKGDRAEKQPAHPTPWLVNGVEAASEYPGIRVLEGVVTSPVLLADGQVLQRPGYHPDSGLLFVPHGDFEPIPDNPSRDDALAALAMLLDLVIDFPFERPEHRSAWLAGLLTALARHAFGGPTPLFLADGNLRGVGKGKLLHSISTIATMREFAVAPYTTDDKELAKTITALVLAGEPYVCFDNVVGYMGGGALDEVLTATEWQGRILGESKQPRIPICTIWYATANNAIIIGDTARRHCPIRLRSFEERPEERTGFKYPDLLGHIRSNRGRLLAAALTILRAYFVAGRPRQSIIPWGSYEEWADLICACIVWLGMPDPGLARKEVTSKTDSDVRALRSLLVGWQELDADREGYTARKAIEKLKSNADSYPMLREALDAFFDLPFGRLPTPNKLGCTLRKFQDRIADGIYFHAEPSHGGVVKWSVREAKQTEATPTKSNVHPNSNDGWDGGDVGHVQPRDKSFPVGDDEPGKYGSRPEPSFIPTIPTIPPAGAKLYFQDAYGRPSSQGESEMWTWEGAPQWYRTDDNAPAGLPETG